MNLKTGSRWLVVVVAALVAVLAVSACGKSKKKKSAAAGNTLSVTITESGKTAKYAMPATIKGGLTTLRVTNNGKAPHQAQLAKIDGHTPQELFKIVAANNPKIPDWLRAVGVIRPTPPLRGHRTGLPIYGRDPQGPRLEWSAAQVRRPVELHHERRHRRGQVADPAVRAEVARHLGALLPDQRPRRREAALQGRPAE